VREADGLALSSRNLLLSHEARKAATVLHRCLQRCEELVHAGEADAQTLLNAMSAVMQESPMVELDYLVLADPLHLKPVERVSAGTVALVAARVGSVRLIDNLIMGPPGTSPDLLLQLAFSELQVVDSGARIPGLETEALCRRIASCRDCAAMSAVQIPPREFMAKYLKSDCLDLNRVRVVVIGRDAPMNRERYFYKHPESPNNFATALYKLLGVDNFEVFNKTFVFTDAMRCHVQSEHVPEKALAYCARHLRDELSQFPNLEAVVVLGEDAYLQFQRNVLNRGGDEIKPFVEIMKQHGWAQENVHVPQSSAGTVHVIYSYHPVIGYKRSPSLAAALPHMAA
jgi:hypothetical protein